MSGIEVEALIFVFIAFAMGVLIGVVAIASYAYRREDERGSLPGRAPGAVCQGARRLTGVGTIGPAGWTIPGQRPGDEDTQRTEARR
jgi:hypothetical protein